MPTGEKILERRLARMRSGKASCEIVRLPSDKEMQFAIIPLTESEFDLCQKAAFAKVEGTTSVVELALYEREFHRQVIFRSARELNDLEMPAFENVDQVTEALEHTDLNHAWEEYQTMTEELSPSLESISVETLGELKKAFVEADWNGLSGKSWSLLKRFLGSISTELPPAN